MKCAAIKNNGDSCTQGISTGSVFTIEEWVYRTCANHKNTIDKRVLKGTPLSHSMFDPTRRTSYRTTAVIGDTHIDLNTGAETTQLTMLEKEKKTMDAINVLVRAVVIISDTRISVLPEQFRFQGTLQEFKAKAQDRLSNDRPYILGYAARNGNELLLVTREKAIALTNVSIVVLPKSNREVTPAKANSQNRPNGPGTRVERTPGYVCGNCSYWEKGHKVEVRHDTVDEVRACFTVAE